MELLRINASKLKITMSARDCERYGICEVDGEFDSRLVREVIKDILEDAGAGGFCHSGEKLLVQLYPSADGAELFVTKLAGVGERELKAIDESRNLDTYRRARAVWVFDSAADLRRAARLGALDKKSADLYLRPDGRYFLVVEEESMGALSDLEMLSEFATRFEYSRAAPRPEWDRLLAEGDAVARIRALGG